MHRPESECCLSRSLALLPQLVDGLVIFGGELAVEVLGSVGLLDLTVARAAHAAHVFAFSGRLSKRHALHLALVAHAAEETAHGGLVAHLSGCLGKKDGRGGPPTQRRRALLRCHR